MIRINKFTLLLILLGAAFFSLPLKAQVNVGSQNDPQPFSLLELTTTIQKGGLRLPQLTTDKRDALTPTLLSNPETAKGLLIYNTTTDCIEFWDGAEWVKLCNDKANIFFTNPGGNPRNPEDLVDPTEIPFSGYGEPKGPFVPHDTPECTTVNPAYSFTIMSGNEYTTIVVSNPAIGEFTINMTANPSYTTPRTAIVRITDNCMGDYQDFVFVQDVIPCTPPAQPSVITGDTTVCSGTTTPHTYSVTNVSGVTYKWTLPSGWTQTGGTTTNSITVTAGTAGGNIIVTPSNSCGSGTQRTLNVTVNKVPAQPSVITGDTTVCSGTTTPHTYSVSNVSGVTYNWKLPDGWTQTGGTTTNSITVTASATAVSGNISVTPSNSCGSGTQRTLNVTVNKVPAQPSAITGDITVSADTTTLHTYSVASVSGATSYTWTVPAGWNIKGGQGTNSITVTTGTASGTITVMPSNNCGNGTARTMNVYIQGAGTLTGRTCFDIAYSNSGGICGELSGRTWTADFNKDSIRTQTYTFTPSGTVSKVRFSFVESPTDTGIIVDSLITLPTYATAVNITTPCTATLYYKKSLNTRAQKLTSDNARKVNILCTYNDNSAGTGRDTTVMLTAQIKDCSCCGAMISATEYKVFMCHNLGADYSADPFKPDQALHGNMYKWGVNTPALTAADNIAISGAISDWADRGTPPSGYYWDNDPCPTGYRLPNRDEIIGMGSARYGGNNTVTSVGNPNNSPTNWTSGTLIGDNLFVPAAGYRYELDGSLRARGDVDSTWGIGIINDASTNTGLLRSSTSFSWVPKSRGYQLRCMAE